MATIIENLKKILEARYGKDVRQAIHDSIENCYNDGKAGSIDLQARQMLGDTNISSIADGTVTGSVKTLSDKATANEEAISEVNNKLGNTDISAIGDGTVTGGLDALNSNLNAKFIWTRLSNAQTDAWGNLHIDVLEKYIPISVVAFSDYIGMLYQKSSYEWFAHFMTDNQDHTIASNFTFANVLVLWVRDPNFL